MKRSLVSSLGRRHQSQWVLLSIFNYCTLHAGQRPQMSFLESDEATFQCGAPPLFPHCCFNLRSLLSSFCPPNGAVTYCCLVLPFIHHRNAGLIGYHHSFLLVERSFIFKGVSHFKLSVCNHTVPGCVTSYLVMVFLVFFVGFY